MTKELDLSQTQIEMLTSQVANQEDITTFLTENSIEVAQLNELTIWHFNDASEILSIVHQLQTMVADQEISFRWVEKVVPALILQWGELPYPEHLIQE